MTVLLGTFFVLVIVHIIKGHTKIINIIKDILNSKGIIRQLNKIKEDEKHENEKMEEEDRKIKKIKIKGRTSTKKYLTGYKKKKIENLNAPFIRNTIKKSKTNKPQKMNIDDIVYNTKDEMNKATITIGENNSQKIENKNKVENNNKIEDEKKILEKYKNITEAEMNSLDYEEAIIIDKRTFWKYYISLLKREHLIIFSFITANDYNFRTIKIILFIASFSLFFTINGFFFTDETMNKIYEDNAHFNFIFQLPQILYSSIISSVINIILQRLSITEEQVFELKQEDNKESLKKNARKIKRKIKIKLTIFLILSSVLILFFWYFISCFCVVYQNIQVILLEDTLISFLTSMIYPFGFELLPAIFRIPALRAPNKDRKYFYKLSWILNLL